MHLFSELFSPSASPVSSEPEEKEHLQQRYVPYIDGVDGLGPRIYGT
jgi:hypothetical protein